MNALQQILQILSIGATAAAGIASNPDVKAGAGVAEALLSIAQKAIAAHEAHTGEPIDLSLLKPIEPIV